MNDRKRAVQARIYGKVQGVSYRIWARGEATRFGLLGWVRNETDGSVTAWLTGADAAVAAMIERLRQGPPGAAVSRIDLEELETWTTPGDFRIIA
ncbi:acylphosphatase [Mesorhizobium sp. SARCC-RB16n]|uniref:acylphosphatase n=1 Tax=Mesorhizobium sp. SARCC-RB16n TaxID=2116687 RepID=UPI00122F5691|nr:acylphosphatase [Mesorhizobium sp. SARCC-RB16n]KAA3450906.1 acylphosphatase [Mesorhizobium sp. SARCC-RB16n]